ncbi:MAG: DUF5678 domain-containing protein [Armatimonadota bacterium]
MVQRLLISGDNPEAVEAIRRIAEEGGLAVTRLGDEANGGWSWRDDHEAYERRREVLGREYEGQYIAMRHGRVIGVGETAKDAAREGLERLDDPDSLFVVKAGEPLPEPEESGMQMEAPRSVAFEQ